LSIQVIMVTHDPHMVRVADRIFETTQNKGRSSLTVTDA